MEHHPAAEAPQSVTEQDGTVRPETEQERITRIQTAMQSMTDRAYRKPLPGSIDLAAYLGKGDFRNGDIVDYQTPDRAPRTAEVIGRDRENIYIRFHDKGTQTRVHHTSLHMVARAEETPDAAPLITPPADLPTREQAAAEFVETIINPPSAKTFAAWAEREGVTPSYDTIKLPIKLLHRDAQVPTQAKEGDAGYDLHSIEQVSINAGGRRLIGTGIAVAIPLGYVGFIKPRSGLANKQGIDVLGGVIDAGYRGELKVILHNTGQHPAGFFVGDRIAQLVIQPVAALRFETTEQLPDSERSEGGFGSSGA